MENGLAETVGVEGNDDAVDGMIDWCSVSIWAEYGTSSLTTSTREA